MDKRFDAGLLLAEKAGRFLKDSFGRSEILQNLDYDVKLAQDRKSEDIIISGIEEAFPGDGFIAEERGEKKTCSGYTWVIDPLDGSVNYSRDIPHCCVSIACKNEGGHFGIVYDFFRNEMFKAATGRGAFLNGQRVNTSRTEDFKDSIMCFGLMKELKEINSGLAALSKLALKVKKIRTFGAAALDLCYVASGRTDFFIEAGLKVWDLAAGSVIVEEAGGRYREFYSGDTVFSYAGNGLLDMEEIIRTIRLIYPA